MVLSGVESGDLRPAPTRNWSSGSTDVTFPADLRPGWHLMRAVVAGVSSPARLVRVEGSAGEACSSDGQCGSGACVNGVCCERACPSGACALGVCPVSLVTADGGTAAPRNLTVGCGCGSAAGGGGVGVAWVLAWVLLRWKGRRIARPDV
jgi:hypothetical protein